MSDEIAEKSIDLESKLKYSYFINKFECSAQLIFDEICDIKNISPVKFSSLIKRGNIYLKADYFIPLRSFDTFQLNCEELLNKIKTIKYLLDVEVDSNFILSFRFQRSEVYIAVLDEVITFGDNYGMNARNDSVLILIDNEDSNTFIKTRNNIIAKHIISVLCANKATVYYSGASFIKNPIFKNAIKITCDEGCCLDDICVQMKKNLQLSEFKKESEKIDDICIDAKIYLEKNSFIEKYGKDIHSIVITDVKNSDTLKKVAFIKHLLKCHISKVPNVIIHIASHAVNRTIWKVGILLQMLEKVNYTQSYIFNQNVKICDKQELSYDDYILSHKNGIENAMAHKYEVDVSLNEIWSSRIDNLVNSVVTFDFLKLNPNMALKLDFSNSHSTDKNAGIFVQYNFARLSNLFKKFESKIEEGFYDPLQPLQEVDFSLLRLEEEWNLLQYVVLFPKLVERISNSLITESTLKTRYPINGICTMLSELCHYLSLYYSKVRILAGPQKHLQQIMNARIWLLKGIYQVLFNSFRLLDIQGLDLM